MKYFFFSSVCRNKKFTERDATKLLKQILEGIKVLFNYMNK